MLSWTTRANRGATLALLLLIPAVLAGTGLRPAACVMQTSNLQRVAIQVIADRNIKWRARLIDQKGIDAEVIR